MPSAIQAMSRRYEFWKTPDDLQNEWTCADGPHGFFHGNSILSGSVGFKWVIPGTVIHLGACVGSWFFAKKPGSGSRDTTSWRCVFPLANTHLPGAILNACRYERRLAEANANRNTHFSVRHFRGMTSSEDSPSSSLWDVNGGLSNDNKNTLETCKNPRPTSGWSELTKSCTT